MKPYYIVITPFFPTPEAFYGSFIYDQVEELQNQGKHLLILRPCPWHKAKQQDYNYNGVNVHYFPCMDMPSYILNGLTDGINRRFFKRFLKKNFPNIKVKAVHCHTSQCALYGNIIKELYPECTSIIQYHELDPFIILNGRFANAKWNLAYKIHKTMPKLAKFDIHVSVSPRVQENLKFFPLPSAREMYEPYLQKLKKIPSSIQPLKIKKSVILINGVNTKLFYKEQARKDANGRFTIGCIGNYLNLKRHIILIKAAELLKSQGITDISVKMVGNNPPDGYQVLKSYVASHQLEDIIEFCPPYRHEDLRGFYNSIDLFVLPSVFEGLGCVFLEAYACGTPFISCRNQGIDDLIVPEEKSLWLIEQDNYTELADKILQYKENRYEQHLVDAIDIHTQIKRFLEETGLS